MQVDIEVLRQHLEALMEEGVDVDYEYKEVFGIFDRACVLSIGESSNGQPTKRKRSYTRKVQPTEQPAGE